MERHRTIRQAFTLVEILTVIVIAAILGSLLMVALKNARARVNEAVCASNMRQIGLALQMYSNDHGNYPATTHNTALKESWIYTLADYLADVDEIRICPADPHADDRLQSNGTSYILNSYVFVRERDPFGTPIGIAYDRPSMIPNPSKTILAFIVSDFMPIGSQSDHTHSSNWTTWSAVRQDIQPNRHGGNINDPTSGSSNYLFADGHVEGIPAIEVKRRTEQGENIASIQ